jgi:hypothetical protein
MVYATKYMQRSKVIAFEYIQIMKPPISREREDSGNSSVQNNVWRNAKMSL